jgi:phosphoribosyl-ATP pyrophosphohydrolase/phosphoribosyl-AMP cyclohydrolase
MKINFDKGNGLVPAVIQDNNTMKVLMVGYMNREAYLKTLKEKRVTFFSRSRKKLWTKGETSGNFLDVEEIKSDCDNDALLIRVRPEGPVCHKGTFSCFEEEGPRGFLYTLEEIINQRIKEDTTESYTNRLFKEGLNRIAQKVGEEAVELVIEAKENNEESFKNEAADLIYHFLVLLKAKNTCLLDIEEILAARHETARKQK